MLTQCLHGRYSGPTYVSLIRGSHSFKAVPRSLLTTVPLLPLTSGANTNDTNDANDANNISPATMENSAEIVNKNNLTIWPMNTGSVTYVEPKYLYTNGVPIHSETNIVASDPSKMDTILYSDIKTSLVGQLKSLLSPTSTIYYNDKNTNNTSTYISEKQNMSNPKRRKKYNFALNNIPNKFLKTISHYRQFRTAPTDKQSTNSFPYILPLPRKFGITNAFNVYANVKPYDMYINSKKYGKYREVRPYIANTDMPEMLPSQKHSIAFYTNNKKNSVLNEVSADAPISWDTRDTYLSPTTDELELKFLMNMRNNSNNITVISDFTVGHADITVNDLKSENIITTESPITETDRHVMNMQHNFLRKPISDNYNVSTKHSYGNLEQQLNVYSNKIGKHPEFKLNNEKTKRVHNLNIINRKKDLSEENINYNMNYRENYDSLFESNYDTYDENRYNLNKLSANLGRQTPRGVDNFDYAYQSHLIPPPNGDYHQAKLSSKLKATTRIAEAEEDSAMEPYALLLRRLPPPLPNHHFSQVRGSNEYNDRYNNNFHKFVNKNNNKDQASNPPIPPDAGHPPSHTYHRLYHPRLLYHLQYVKGDYTHNKETTQRDDDDTARMNYEDHYNGEPNGGGDGRKLTSYTDYDGNSRGDTEYYGGTIYQYNDEYHGVTAGDNNSHASETTLVNTIKNNATNTGENIRNISINVTDLVRLGDSDNIVTDGVTCGLLCYTDSVNPNTTSTSTSTSSAIISAATAVYNIHLGRVNNSTIDGTATTVGADDSRVVLVNRTVNTSMDDVYLNITNSTEETFKVRYEKYRTEANYSLPGMSDLTNCSNVVDGMCGDKVNNTDKTTDVSISNNEDNSNNIVRSEHFDIYYNRNIALIDNNTNVIYNSDIVHPHQQHRQFKHEQQQHHINNNLSQERRRQQQYQHHHHALLPSSHQLPTNSQLLPLPPSRVNPSSPPDLVHSTRPSSHPQLKPPTMGEAEVYAPPFFDFGEEEGVWLFQRPLWGYWHFW